MKQLLIAVILALGCAARASAAPITITEVFTATGSFAGSAFTGALVSLTLVGDTDDVTGTTIAILPGNATVEVAGLGIATLTNDIRAVVNQSIPAAGISDFTQNLAILFIGNAAFSTFDLSQSIGPLTGGASFNPTAFFPISLPGGGFKISSVSSQGTYTAVTQAVPEPGGLMLLGTGVLALWNRRRRHRQVR